MKRSFYDMIGVENSADQATIDSAYAHAMERLNEGIKRGATSSIITLG